MAIERRDVNRSDLFVGAGMALEKTEKSGRLVGEIRLAAEEAENWEGMRELEEKEGEEEEGVEEEESSSYSGSEEEEEEEEEKGSLSLLHLLAKNLAQVSQKPSKFKLSSLKSPSLRLFSISHSQAQLKNPVFR